MIRILLWSSLKKHIRRESGSFPLLHFGVRDCSYAGDEQNFSRRASAALAYDFEINLKTPTKKKQRNLVPRVSLAMGRETLIGAGHVALLDKHCPTGVESSFYFDPQLRKSVIVRQGIFSINNLYFTM